MNSSKRPWILVLAGIVLLGFTSVVFWFVQARDTPSQDSCFNMLRQIDGAKQQWAAENHKTTNDLPTWADLAPYSRRNLHCPQGGTYTLGRAGALDTCSIPEHAKVWKEANGGAN